jgi:general secretion pathway protein M
LSTPTSDHPLERAFARYPLAAVLAYWLIVAVLLAIVAQCILGVADRYATVSAAADLLAQIEDRRPAGLPGAAPVTAPTGAPFLEGPTVTVAGAALLQRVTGAVAKVGGTIQSSQVELQGAKAGEGFISLTASCEMPYAMLQPFLYDLEAGMPFLFVDQLVAQAPQAAGGAENGPMRVLLNVSGQWKGAP